VRIILHNHLREPTSIHFHGLVLPNAMDGVPYLTQPSVKPGQPFTYEFVAQPAGSHICTTLTSGVSRSAWASWARSSSSRGTDRENRRWTPT
jgi:hypothetical protein